MRQITYVLPMALKIVEVHNVYTIYGVNPDGTEAQEPFAQMSRPQDWGNFERWHYERFCFEWIQETMRYINNAHCWTDLKLERYKYPSLFAPLVVQIFMPGANPKLCAMDYLDEDDFWSDDWGEMHPYFEPLDKDEEE